MEKLNKFLKFMSGKKTIISVILGAIVSYCAVKGWIGEPEVVLYGTISIALFGTASVLTTKMYNAETKKDDVDALMEKSKQI